MSYCLSVWRPRCPRIAVGGMAQAIRRRACLPSASTPEVPALSGCGQTAWFGAHDLCGRSGCSCPPNMRSLRSATTYDSLWVRWAICAPEGSVVSAVVSRIRSSSVSIRRMAQGATADSFQVDRHEEGCDEEEDEHQDADWWWK